MQVITRTEVLDALKEEPISVTECDAGIEKASI